jgi:hypothetical protein
MALANAQATRRSIAGRTERRETFLIEERREPFLIERRREPPLIETRRGPLLIEDSDRRRHRHLPQSLPARRSSSLPGDDAFDVRHYQYWSARNEPYRSRRCSSRKAKSPVVAVKNDSNDRTSEAGSLIPYVSGNDHISETGNLIPYGSGSVRPYKGKPRGKPKGNSGKPIALSSDSEDQFNYTSESDYDPTSEESEQESEPPESDPPESGSDRFEDDSDQERENENGDEIKGGSDQGSDSWPIIAAPITTRGRPTWLDVPQFPLLGHNVCRHLLVLYTALEMI